jgi:hypothetical protein
MLKLIYTESGFRLELLTQSLEEWVTTRVLLAVRSATNLCVEPSTASFMLPTDLPELAHLTAVEYENGEILDITPCDADFVEVSLQGTWLVSDPDSEEGIFVTAMSHRAEFLLFKLWEEAENLASVVND